MNKGVKKFLDNVKSVSDIDFLGSDDKKSYKISILDLSFIPIGVMIYYIKQFILLAAVFAGFITLLSFSTGYSVVCNFPDFRDNPYFSCSISSGLYITFFFLRLLLIAIFIRLWHGIIIKDESFKYSEIMSKPAQDLKVFGGLILFILVNFAPFISLLILYDRVPNPDWKIESLFFAVTSIGFILPFFAVRFYSLFGFALAEKKFPSFSELLYRTKGNTLKIMIALSILLIFDLIIYVNYNVLTQIMLSNNLLVFGILFDYLYNIIYLLFFALFINHCLMQQGLLFGLRAVENEE